MFAQTINFVDDVMEYDYQELLNNFMVIGAISAVILGNCINNCVRLNSQLLIRFQTGSTLVWIFVRIVMLPLEMSVSVLASIVIISEFMIMYLSGVR